MKKRDLKADLELCNRATPGPWEAEDGLADPMVVMGRDYSHYFYVHTEWDAQFIAQAREGWPHAIERALKAERALGNETILNGKALAKLKERADKAEALVNELRSDSKTDDAVMEGQEKRIEELESLVRELAETLRLYEQWEAELITDNSLWQSASGLPFITQEVWDELVAIQTERNRVLQDTKEVLNAD